MLINFEKYKEKYHFSVNFYSIFLIVTAIPDILHISSSLIVLPFWFIKILLAIWIILKDKTYRQSFSRIEILYFILAFIYAVNIFADIFMFPRRVLGTEHGAMDFIGFVIGIILALSFRNNPLFYSEKSFKFFVISLAIALIIAYFTSVPSVAIYDEAGLRLDANSTVNTILYGITGCALSITSIFGFLKYRRWIIKCLFIITFIIGFVSMAKAGSRSPVLVLMLVGTFFLVARLGGVKSFIILFILASLVMIFINPIIDLFHSMGSGLIDRLTLAISERDTSGRDIIYKNVLNIIERSPLLGAYYLVPSGFGAGLYPHNYILEVFMATGLLGGIPFLVLVFFSLRKAFKLIKMRHPATWIVILYLQIIFYGMFSTGLYTTEDFWILLFFMLSLKIDNVELPDELPVTAKVSQKIPSFIQ